MKLRRICCVSRAELNRLEKLFNDFSGECFFVYLYESNLIMFLQCFDKRILRLVACKNSGSVMIRNGFFFSSTLMLLRVIALHSLYLFVCQKDKISRGTVRARFNQAVFSISSRRVGPSASTGEHCICIVSDLLWLGLVWSCFVFCPLFLLFYVICAPVLTEGTRRVEISVFRLREPM